MSDLFPEALPDLDAQIAEVRRELDQRARVYPRFISQGTLKPERAKRQEETLRAALHSLEATSRPRAAAAEVVRANASFMGTIQDSQAARKVEADALGSAIGRLKEAMR